MKRFIIFTISILVLGKSTASIQVNLHPITTWYLFRIELYFTDSYLWSVNPRKISHLLSDKLNKFEYFDSLNSQGSSIHNLIYFLQLNSAEVLEIDTNYLKPNYGCCDYNNPWYYVSDSVLEDAHNKVTYPSRNWCNFSYNHGNERIVFSVVKISGKFSRCEEARALTEEINYSDSISFICDLKSSYRISESDSLIFKQNLDEIMKSLK